MENAREIDILHEEGPCLVVNKPSGLLTQAPVGIDSLEARLKDLFRARLGRSGRIYLAVPHRLDRPVSGAMVFARHVRAARRISEQFESRTVEKVYWVCVAGRIMPEAGTWRDTLRKIPDKPLAEVVDDDHPEGRPAILHYRVLGRAAWGTWLEIRLETGRTHQIRIQTASRGHPVLGDELYGSTAAFGTQFDDARYRAIALHSRRLAFRHPMTRQPVEVVAPLPIAWVSLGFDVG
ncbi:MAG: RluA family pseudouridine synthase [Pirellulaceae bacterium]|nr:RluA family pseudouridine synthase [Pirellulaceae bacterium]